MLDREVVKLMGSVEKLESRWVCGGGGVRVLVGGGVVEKGLQERAVVLGL
jgi:hypothetical protein